MNRANPPAGGSAPSPSTDLWAGIAARIRREKGLRGRLRSLPTPTRYLLAGALLFSLAGLSAAALLRTDLGPYPDLRFGASLAILSVMTLLGAVVLLRPLQLPGLQRRLLLVLAGAALLAPLALALAPEAHHAGNTHPESFADRDGHFSARAAGCLFFGIVAGLPLLAALLLLDRRDGRGILRGVLLAATAGLAGNVVLFLHCPLVSPAHLAAGHATVPLALVVLVAVGVWAGRARRGRAHENETL